jgi:hypothetical protein
MSRDESVHDSRNSYYARKRVSLYKTEMCRSYEEAGHCKYGERCQFAHKSSELRNIPRHPRYKTETCRTFWEEGNCPYGKRCCFIHTENKSLLKEEYIGGNMEEDSDDSLIGEIATSIMDEDRKAVGSPSPIDLSGDRCMDLRPFWYTNEANIWVPENMSFCYIRRRNDRYYGVSEQSRAPGEPVIPKTERKVGEFVFSKPGL